MINRLSSIAIATLFAAVPLLTPKINTIRPESVFIPTYIIFTDPRISLLDEFFVRHECPYRDTAEYLKVADGEYLDYRLLPAISVLEESCGKHNPVNNLFGYYGSGPYGLRPFKSIAEGVDYVGYQLAYNPLYRGKTLKQKLKVYNSINPEYYREIIALMNQIEKK